MIEHEWEIYCDGDCEHGSEKEPAQLGLLCRTKKELIGNARDSGWSVGKRHLCPVCKMSKKLDKIKAEINYKVTVDIMANKGWSPARIKKAMKGFGEKRNNE